MKYLNDQPSSLSVPVPKSNSQPICHICGEFPASYRCPSCGRVICERCTIDTRCSVCSPPPTVKEKGEPTRINHPIGWFILGLFFGASCGIWMVLFGIGLCCTGIGAIVGIPLILAGIIMPFICGPVASIGMTRLTGKCPYCRTLLRIDPQLGWTDCCLCKARIMIRNNYLYKTDDYPAL